MNERSKMIFSIICILSLSFGTKASILHKVAKLIYCLSSTRKNFPFKFCSVFWLDQTILFTCILLSDRLESTNEGHSTIASCCRLFVCRLVHRMGNIIILLSFCLCLSSTPVLVSLLVVVYIYILNEFNFASNIHITNVSMSISLHCID